MVPFLLKTEEAEAGAGEREEGEEEEEEEKEEGREDGGGRKGGEEKEGRLGRGEGEEEEEERPSPTHILNFRETRRLGKLCGGGRGVGLRCCQTTLSPRRRRPCKRELRGTGLRHKEMKKKEEGHQGIPECVVS